MSNPELEVVPAYGRDYIYERCVRADWVLNLRFRPADQAGRTRVGKDTVCMEEARALGILIVKIGFRLRKGKPQRFIVVGTGTLGVIPEREA